jgi:hypothetical protein
LRVLQGANYLLPQPCTPEFIQQVREWEAKTLEEQESVASAGSAAQAAAQAAPSAPGDAASSGADGGVEQNSTPAVRLGDLTVEQLDRRDTHDA